MKAKLIINNQEIEVEISEEEYKKLQPEKKTGYERVKNKTYFWITGDGRLLSQVDNSKADALSYESANYYSDSTVAENNARADKLMRQLRRFAVEHRETEIDWNCISTSKYCIIYDCEDRKIIIDGTDIFRYFGNVVFDSEQTARLAIDAFYNELIWYFTEYKDSL
jgi:hypothetical protein